MPTLNIADPQFEFDPEDPEGFRAGLFRLGGLVGAQRTGMSVYELPPGELLCPYHYEYGEEEWLVVLHGRPFLRTPAGTEELKPFDVAFFPRGPEGAHQVGNRTDEPARVLMWSELTYPSATAYPDSDKVGVWTGVKPEDLIVERSSGVEYYRGESAGS
ncbi:MAG TPA: cupin domain-containing protein [Gaiellaceae bacterium]